VLIQCCSFNLNRTKIVITGCTTSNIYEYKIGLQVSVAITNTKSITYNTVQLQHGVSEKYFVADVYATLC